MELKDVVDRIHQMSIDELDCVRRAVEIRRSYMARVTLDVGDTVEFNAGPRRGMRRGTIEKINTKRYVVRTTDGMKWTVAPQLLRRVAVMVSA